jgi:hypothetical protein
VNKKSQLDKFYTRNSLAHELVESLPQDFDLWLEPSAGAGAFLHHLPQPRIGLDLEPDDVEILQADFFDWQAPAGSRIAVVGNPPFGYQSALAIKFFNHAATFASLIAFILPRTFRKSSIQNKISLDWVLQDEHILPENSFICLNDDGTMYDYSVPAVWQVWVPGKRAKVVLKTSHPDWQWCDSSTARYAMRRVGGLAGRVYSSDWEHYSTQSHYYFNASDVVAQRLIDLYPTFQSISKDTAGNPSIGKGEVVLAYSNSLKK